MFDIQFIGEEPEAQEEGWQALRGRITLGEFTEEFLAALGPWNRADYERHWIEAARRLLVGADRTGFFTSAFQFWWTMWRKGQDLFVHEQLIIEATLLEPFDPSDPYRQIGERETEDEDGNAVSEWQICLTDIRDFVARREEQYLSSLR